jgi:hypothetical protein
MRIPLELGFQATASEWAVQGFAVVQDETMALERVKIGLWR